MSGGASQAWFIAGTIPLIAAGAGHALLALFDAIRPRFFTPVDDRARAPMEATGIRLRAMFPWSSRRPSLWNVWLGINVSHGLGLVVFGLACLLVATHDFRLIDEVAGIRPLTIAAAAAWLALSLRFFFYGPVLVTGSATACFVISGLVA